MIPPTGFPRRFELACIGRAAIDLYGEQIGCRLEDVTTFAKYLGGSPANTAVGASRLGIRAAMITRVGHEQNGNFVREALAREGVDVSQVSTDPERLTALVFLSIRDRDEFPHIFYRDRCADMALTAAHIDPEFIASCGALLLSGTHLSQPVTRSACEKAITAARDAGTRIVLDIDYRPVLWGLAAPGEGASRFVASEAVTQNITPFLAACDLVVGTEEEIRVAGGSDDTLTALRAIRKSTKALLVLKRGPLGCVAFTGPIPARIEEGISHSGFRVEVFNVLGAGDAFMSGFLRGWLRSEPVETCCRYANACGAIVVSRHGCAPAMATWPELERFLATPIVNPRLREDRELDHIHRATTRTQTPERLHVLAFDHRSQLEAVAAAHGCDAQKIADFKALVAEAFEQVAGGNEGFGLIVDGRYGEAVLPMLTGRNYWIGRPVEAPGSIPLAFEARTNVGLEMRTWPQSHVAKCLVFYSTTDPVALRETQIATMKDLAHACATMGRELLLEVIPPSKSDTDALAVARAMESIYASGIRPDWWKLPPSVNGAAWDAIGEAIDNADPRCRGILVLGLEAGMEELRESFAVAARCRWVRGFAVGRSIFADSANEWFAGRATDAQVVETVAERYRDVIALWEAARGLGCASTRERHKEKA